MPDSLEQKSSHGLSPLSVAAALQRPEIMKLLLLAGANPRTVDICRRNVIHNTLVALRLGNSGNSGRSLHSQTPLSPLTEPKLLEAILALFDKKDVKEMLLEKCTLGPQFSSLTPLAYWIANNVPGMYNNVKVHGKADIIEILLSYSDGDDMELINGEGDLPLHQVVKQGLPALTSHLISVRPSLLYRENATGRTPLEVASDAYLQLRVSKGPSIGLDNGYGNHFNYGYNNNVSATASKAALEFLPKKEDDDEQASTKRTYEVCFKAAESYPAKRRLVTLFEANEVAKRLAGQKARTSTEDGEESKDEIKGDEVSMWLT